MLGWAKGSLEKVTRGRKPFTRSVCDKTMRRASIFMFECHAQAVQADLVYSAYFSQRARYVVQVYELSKEGAGMKGKGFTRDTLRLESLRRGDETS